MRKPLATRKETTKPYKTRLQAHPIVGYYLRGIGLDNVYKAVEIAIVATRQKKQAATVKALTEKIQEQDNSDLTIIELPELPHIIPAPIEDGDNLMEILLETPDPIIIQSES